MAKAPRILSLDFIRIFIIALVIATHLAATGIFYGSEASGVVWMVSHTSRNIFLAITAFVLFYTISKSDKLNVVQFYKRRFPFVVLPYATWTLIYQLQNGLHQSSVYEFVHVYMYNFLTANAMYNLYFLLLSMQLYLLFPLILAGYRKISKYPFRLLLGSFFLQLVFTLAFWLGKGLPVLGPWLSHPDNYLITYQFYVVCGILAATHYQQIIKLLLRYRRQVYAVTAATVAVGIVLYYIQINGGVSVADAAGIFHPFLVLETVVISLYLLTLGAAWESNGAKHKAVIAIIGENSFGIYLCHVLVIEKLKGYLMPDTNGFFVVLISIAIGVPLVYGVAFCLTELLRKTPLSIYFTGRKQTSRKKIEM